MFKQTKKKKRLLLKVEFITTHHTVIQCLSNGKDAGLLKEFCCNKRIKQ